MHMTQPRLQKVGVHLIVIDAGTQSREMINEATVQEYAEAWEAGAGFPPLDVFQDRDDRYYLADGFHRLLAAKMVRRTTVPCRIFTGSARSAFLHACSANSTHGLRRSNSDKRHMVGILLGDAEWASWTDSRIADVCGVSHPFVGMIRKEFQAIPNSAAASVMHQARCGVDGKTYPATRKRRPKSEMRSKRCDGNEDATVTDTSHKKAIATLKELSKLLRKIGIYEKHAKALTLIARDVTHEPLKKNAILTIMAGSARSIACDVVAAS
jgi:uncharacterized ParB-like nuclease family protein